MSQWNLEIGDEVRAAMEQALLHHPHLKQLVNQRLRALMHFPPDRWFQVRRHGHKAAFFPEPGQKVRLTGLVDFKARKLILTRFSLWP
jgi:hypothetical protein